MADRPASQHGRGSAGHSADPQIGIGLGPPSAPDGSGPQADPRWKWGVCGLLLLATLVNYMDRLTLSQLATTICAELKLSNEQYGQIELGFSLAFAAGGLLLGMAVDRVSVRWMYPGVLVLWSLAGIATAWSQSYEDLLVTRIALGFFEAGQWPCALVTSRRLLSARDRPLGNSILQSGAAVGAIITPLIVQALVTSEPGSWRKPFVVVGAAGLAWVIPWFLVFGRLDPDPLAPLPRPAQDAPRDVTPFPWRMFLVLTAVVILISLCWHFFRVWMPKFLEEYHHYPPKTVRYFTSAFYVATDAGCLSVGWATTTLARGRLSVHSARRTLFGICAGLTSLTAVAAFVPPGPLLLGLLLLVGFGALGLFPLYYSLSQELPASHMGKLTGVLSCVAWIPVGLMQPVVGAAVDKSGSYSAGIFLSGLAPLAAWVVLWFAWPATPEHVTSERS